MEPTQTKRVRTSKSKKPKSVKASTLTPTLTPTPTPTPAPTQKTHIIFIIDESGSMGSVASDVRGGFNTYVERLKGDGNEYSLTAIKFGTTVRPLFTNLALGEVPLLTEKNYMPSDTTALYDAIGYGLGVADKAWATEKHPYGEDRVLFIIQTDGYENASREFSKGTIVQEMKQREEAGNWTFIYMGADQDAWGIASTFGISQGNVLSYASNNTSQMYHRLAVSTSTVSGTSLSQTRSFFNPEP